MKPLYHPIVRPPHDHLNNAQVPHPTTPTVQHPTLKYAGGLDFELMGVPLAHYASVQKVRILP